MVKWVCNFLLLYLEEKWKRHLRVLSSLGSSSNYIYVLANDNNYSNGPRSEEVLQIRKSDMKINKIWTVRISDDRYVHNATFIGDNTMYALFHNGGYDNYK